MKRKIHKTIHEKLKCREKSGNWLSRGKKTLRVGKSPPNGHYRNHFKLLLRNWQRKAGDWKTLLWTVWSSQEEGPKILTSEVLQEWPKLKVNGGLIHGVRDSNELLAPTFQPWSDNQELLSYSLTWKTNRKSNSEKKITQGEHMKE